VEKNHTPGDERVLLLVSDTMSQHAAFNSYAMFCLLHVTHCPTSREQRDLNRPA
jgi:hypothetical protein